MTHVPLDPPSEPGALPSWARGQETVVLDRYLLGPELGRGGMGRVHAAWDPILKRVVALKLLMGQDPDLHQRLLREARTQAKLDHPGICRIHDLGHWEGRPFIAMQMVQGPSLVELRPELDFRAMAAVLADVAAAIHAAHQAGLIHRDLKPANILVERRGRLGFHPYVVDFGLARDLTALDETLSWAVLGTPAFMSPEQTHGEVLGPATDIYSLGATLYTLITGLPPYEGSTLAGLITSQSDTGVRAVRRLNAQVPKDLETITLRCLEWEPVKRYGNAADLEQDLRHFLAGQPIAARTIGPIGRLWRRARRKPALAATAAVGMLVAALLLAWNGHIRSTSQLREQAAQRFGMEIRDAEHLLRIERMMPRHDIRPAEERLRSRMKAIRIDMARTGSSAQGPGHYALGRGHLALREYALAMAELEAAWGAGFHAPEVAHGLGLASLFRSEEVMAASPLGEEAGSEGLRLRQELLEAALGWMDKASGATVDHQDYGAALVARARGQHAEADRLFARALDQAPWLYEAWLGRYDNELSAHWGQGTATRTRDFLHEDGLAQRLDEYLKAAQRLAPSDETILFRQSRLCWNPIKVSLNPKGAVHFQEAAECLQQALVIQPEAPRLRLERPGLATLTAARMLSRGQDPAPLLEEQALQLSHFGDRKDWAQEADWMQAREILHRLWCLKAEADHRFGRNPMAAIRQARPWRSSNPDINHAYPLLVEAQYLIDHGQSPAAVLADIKGLVASLDATLASHRMAFIPCESGQALLEVGRWLYTTGQPHEEVLQAALAHLNEAVALDPRHANTFRPLPRLHALLARIALAEGRDPDPSLRAALTAGLRGVALYPTSTTIRAACVDALLADAEVRSARGQDPTPCLSAAAKHLEEAERLNPRDYRLVVLRAQVELQVAEWATRQGREASVPLAAATRACRKGRSLKADEPTFPRLLARIASLAKVEGLGPGQPRALSDL